ncbi:MAG: hypothetical protein HY273_00555 [Gammaproteobacteria bacterium]|nr:hypothetical protein [Gammaproteobacteria bacterium]
MAIVSRSEQLAPATRKGACPMWLRRLGVAGFVFFLVKGLLWLTVPVLIYFFGGAK